MLVGTDHEGHVTEVSTFQILYRMLFYETVFCYFRALGDRRRSSEAHLSILTVLILSTRFEENIWLKHSHGKKTHN